MTLAVQVAQYVWELTSVIVQAVHVKEDLLVRQETLRKYVGVLVIPKKKLGIVLVGEEGGQVRVTVATRPVTEVIARGVQEVLRAVVSGIMIRTIVPAPAMPVAAHMMRPVVTAMEIFVIFSVTGESVIPLSVAMLVVPGLL